MTERSERSAATREHEVRAAPAEPSLRPGPDEPSAEVLDELLRAFSVDVTDRARNERVDLTSPEVDLLLAEPSQPAPEVERQDGEGDRSGAGDEAEAVEHEPAEQEPAEPPVQDPSPGTARRTILIADDSELPDAVYLAAGDPLLTARGEPGKTTIGTESGTESSRSTLVVIDDAGPEADVISAAEAVSAPGIEPRLRARRIAVKRATGRRRLRWVFAGLGVVAIVIGGLAVLGSGLFAIEDVAVEGAVYADPVAVEAVVEELRGTPVLRADTEAAERTLEAIPWVETARVTTDFPRAARVELRERTPVAAYQGGDGRFRVIDPFGRVLDVLDSQPIDYLLVTASDAPDLAAGEFAPRGLRAAGGLVEALTAEIRAVAASVSATADGSELQLALTDGTEVRFGPAQDLTAKLVRLQTWLAVGRDGAVSTVDVSTEEVTTTP